MSATRTLSESSDSQPRDPEERNRMKLSGRYRIPLSCKECSRRKIRCDKKFPCRACRERGQGDQCYPRNQSIPAYQSGPAHRPAAAETTEPSQNGVTPQAFQEVQDELIAVRHRLAEIESALGIRRQEKSSSNSDDGIDFRENGLAGAMEEAALGIGQNRRWHGEALMEDSAQCSLSNTPWFSSVSFSDCLNQLPTRRQSHILLEAYCDRLNWIFGCLHRGTLYRHHDTFWSLYEQGKAEDSMTLALLFAVLSVSAFFFEDYQTYAGMPNPEDMEALAQKWFDLSLATFFRCEGLTKPTLTACNTILTLFPAFNLSGNTPIHGSMMQLLIGIGRSTNLHLLGNDNTGSPEMILKRDLGRRAWWQIVEGEWHFLPYQRFTSVAPHQFDTSLPDLTDEDGVIASRTKDVHSLSFLLTCCHSSQIMYDLYGTLRPNEHPSYEAILRASERLDALSDSLPERLKAPMEDFVLGQPNTVLGSRYLAMMLAYRSYLIHRAFFVKSLRDKAYEKSRTACVDAAERILYIAQKGLPSALIRLWNTTLWLVSAGIVLSLDLLLSSKQQINQNDLALQRQRLSHLVNLLFEVRDKSGIATRGAKLISHLCSIERQMTANSPNHSFTRQGIIEILKTGDLGEGPQDTHTQHLPHGNGLPPSELTPDTGPSPTISAPFYGTAYDNNFQSPEFASLIGGARLISENPVDFFEPNGMELDFSQLDNMFKNIVDSM
ncbi:unnamed protein product [Clonostachys rosea]|uniref:Zn(2)-C6 fungal-type domain-containing protein n=1 Tax=Bionectria ochroleuca TaxID=29856 RepID=A0ABY6TY01_BIOOC|nr:unnamed protein product [Clonostachys rosea]